MATCLLFSLCIPLPGTVPSSERPSQGSVSVAISRPRSMERGKFPQGRQLTVRRASALKVAIVLGAVATAVDATSEVRAEDGDGGAPAAGTLPAGTEASCNGVGVGLFRNWLTHLSMRTRRSAVAGWSRRKGISKEPPV